MNVDLKNKVLEGEDGKGRSLHGSHAFYDLIREMALTHDTKSHDYATNDDPFKNYRFAGEIASLFHSPLDRGFAGRMAEKIMRLSVLQDKMAQNEPIEDTEKDIAVIVALWMVARRSERLDLALRARLAAEKADLVRTRFRESFTDVVSPKKKG